MIIKKFHSVDMAALDGHLNKIREKRRYSLTRPSDEDSVFICEPQEMYSLGVRKDILYIKDRLRFEEYRQERNIPLVFLDRGGGIFWHGPGQICIEPVTDIKHLRLNPSEYTMLLEDLCLETLKEFGVYGFRHQYENETTGGKQYGAQGVWVTDPLSLKIKKIAFLGWSDRGGIAIHGCVINISCDLFPFSLIHPCNLEGAEATSIKEIKGTAPSYKCVEDFVARIWKDKIESQKK